MLMFRGQTQKALAPYCERAERSADPPGSRVLPKGWRAAEDTIAGALLPDPTASCLTPKDDPGLKASV